MGNDADFVKSWIRIGAGCGLLGILIYFGLAFFRLPFSLAVALAALFGPLLAVSSVGIYHFMALHKKTATLQIAAVSSVVGGAVVNLMLLVQLGTRSSLRKMIDGAGGESEKETLILVLRGIDKVQLSMDISWDFFISVGIIFFAVNMIRHPRLGKAVGAIGIGTGSVLLGLNFWTFPIPPDQSGLIDLGPLAGAWYLVIIVLILRSFKWVDKAKGEFRAGPTDV